MFSFFQGENTLPVALAGLTALLIFMMGYTFFVPKSKKGFNPGNKKQQLENPSLRRFTALANELMLIMPAGANVSGRVKENPKIDTLLVRAGNPWKVTSAEFRVLQYTGLVVGLLVGLPLGFALHAVEDRVPAAAVVALCVLLGYTTPMSKMKNLAAKRDLEFKRQLPEMLDLMTIAIAGGASFTSSIKSALVAMPDGIVKDDFEKVSKDLASGDTVRDALEKFAQRAPNDSVKTFTKAVQSALKNNSPMVEILASQAKTSRDDFFSYVNQKVAQLESKIWMMLTPTMIPALLITSVLPSASKLMGAI